MKREAISLSYTSFITIPSSLFFKAKSMLYALNFVNYPLGKEGSAFSCTVFLYNPAEPSYYLLQGDSLCFAH